MDDVSRRPSTMLKKHSAPNFSSDVRPNPLVFPKKSHRVAALLETLQSREIDSPPELPTFSRSFSENDARLVVSTDSSSWGHFNYDLKKDTIREFLDEVREKPSLWLSLLQVTPRRCRRYHFGRWCANSQRT